MVRNKKPKDILFFKVVESVLKGAIRVWIEFRRISRLDLFADISKHILVKSRF
ncbi:hypothetical protein [Leptospira weilii]|uniref:hypothetical protein n=1 Tax=Leptospira weilii TaxID=28184 RepID=UPI0002E671D8|nr:hypothetical protein [Leptospira weilii]